MITYKEWDEIPDDGFNTLSTTNKIDYLVYTKVFKNKMYKWQGFTGGGIYPVIHDPEAEENIPYKKLFKNGFGCLRTYHTGSFCETGSLRMYLENFDKRGFVLINHTPPQPNKWEFYFLSKPEEKTFASTVGALYCKVALKTVGINIEIDRY